MKRILLSTGSVLFAASAFGGAAMADDMSGYSVEGNVAIVSDYRFRGVSQTSEELAIQGGLDLSLDSGFYLGAWGSSINFANGTELDVYGGYGGEAGAIAYDVGILAYHYPAPSGASDATIWELYGSLGTTIGIVDASVGFAYIPEQDDTEVGTMDYDNTYVYVSGEMPLGDSPFSLSGTVGYTGGDGAFNFSEDTDFDGFGDDGTWDWSLGISASAGGVDWGLTYVGVDDLQAGLGDEQTVVLSVGRAF